VCRGLHAADATREDRRARRHAGVPRCRAATDASPDTGPYVGSLGKDEAQAENRCHYCGEENRVLIKEHKIPLARGGANNAANIVPACVLCNLRKRILTDEEFFDQMRREAEREEAVGERFRASAADSRR